MQNRLAVAAALTVTLFPGCICVKPGDEESGDEAAEEAGPADPEALDTTGAPPKPQEPASPSCEEALAEAKAKLAECENPEV